MYDKNKIIKEPLWDMMLSTNDCYPGCGCEEDDFNINPDRIIEWLNYNQQHSKTIIDQINFLLNIDPTPVNELMSETNIWFKNADEANKWLEAWSKAIQDATSEKEL